MNAALLIAYPFYRPAMLPLLVGQEWVLDSGAYSALNSGKVIVLSEYIECCRRLLDSPAPPRHIFALDVIGDPVTSLANARAMRAAGLPVIPTWHAGSPVSALMQIAGEFPRIALGGLVGRGAGGHGQALHVSTKRKIIGQAFARIWPKWVHGFGVTNTLLLREFPFASVDSTSWSLNPSKYGGWATFGRLPVRVKGAVTVDCEVTTFLQHQQKHAAQWRRELALVQEPKFSIKLACGSIKDIERVTRH